jgi:hypothetical protein
MRAAVAAGSLVAASSQSQNWAASSSSVCSRIRRVGNDPAVEDEVHHRPPPIAHRRSPVDHEQRAQLDLQAEFLADLAHGAHMRRLAIVHHPAVAYTDRDIRQLRERMEVDGGSS